LDYLELNFLSFFKSLEAFGVDSREVYENIVFARHGNETETFFCVKPLYLPFFHVNPPKNKTYYMVLI